MIRPRAVGIVSLLALAALATYRGANAQPKRVQLKDHGFSLEVPSRWNVAINPDGLPMLTNFPFSKLQPQLTLPEGGAMINFIAWAHLTRRSGDESLPGWARLDEKGSAKPPVASGVLETRPDSGVSTAITTSFDEKTYSPDDQRQHEFSVYWIYRDQKFAAHLFYLAGDPKGQYYEDTLGSIVRSTKPLASAPPNQK